MVLGSALVALAALAFWGYCAYDFARTDPRDMRTFSQPVWLMLLVFANVLGALLWYAAGRPQQPGRR